MERTNACVKRWGEHKDLLCLRQLTLLELLFNLVLAEDHHHFLIRSTILEIARRYKRERSIDGYTID